MVFHPIPQPYSTLRITSLCAMFYLFILIRLTHPSFFEIITLKSAQGRIFRVRIAWKTGNLMNDPDKYKPRNPAQNLYKELKRRPKSIDPPPLLIPLKRPASAPAASRRSIPPFFSGGRSRINPTPPASSPDRRGGGSIVWRFDRG